MLPASPPSPSSAPRCTAPSADAPELWTPPPKRWLTITVHLLGSPPCPAPAARPAQCLQKPLAPSLAQLGPSGEGGGACPAGVGRSAALSCGASTASVQGEGGTGQPVLPQSLHGNARPSTGESGAVACQTGKAPGMAFPGHSGNAWRDAWFCANDSCRP